MRLDFIQLGAIRTGKQWITQCLKEHPQLCLPNSVKAKPLSYLLTDKEGYDDYCQSIFNCEEGQIRGSGGGHYLTSRELPGLIKENYPDIKMIVVLRNPVEIVYSMYYHQKSRGIGEEFAFENILSEKPDYLEHGFHYKNLTTYLNVLPRENILILFYEDLKRNPLRFMQTIYKFIGADDSFIPPSINRKVNFVADDKMKVSWFSERKIKNTKQALSKNFIGKTIRCILRATRATVVINTLLKKNERQAINTSKEFERPKMREEIKNELKLLYRDDIINLEKLLNKDLRTWK